MASNPFNALMDPMQFGMGLQNAFQMGMQNRQQAETQRALGAYAQNQSPETAAAVSRHNPMLGMQLQDREAQRQAQMAAQEQKAFEAKLLGDALLGDPAARQQIAYVNAEWYTKLADREKAAVDQTMNAVAQQAFSILQRPPAERGPLLNQALAAMKAQGLNTDEFSLSGDPTQDLMSALAMTGYLDDWERFARPDYVPRGEAGLAGFQFGVPILDQSGQPRDFGVPAQSGNLPQVFDGGGYESLPPGAQYVDPNGNVRVKPGGAGGNVSGNFPG